MNETPLQQYIVRRPSVAEALANLSGQIEHRRMAVRDA